MKTFPVECISESVSTVVSARIKRFDGKSYNPSTKRFEDNNSLRIKLVNDSNQSIYHSEIPILINPVEFLDGRYTVYYYDGDKVVGAVYEEIDDGSHVPVSLTADTLTSIAVRVAGIQTIDGSLKNTLNKLSKLVSEIRGRV